MDYYIERPPNTPDSSDSESSSEEEQPITATKTESPSELKRLIATGTYGEIYLIDGKIHKKFKDDLRDDNSYISSSFIAELNSLMLLKNVQHCIQLESFDVDELGMSLTLHYYPDELSNVLRKITPAQFKKYTYQLFVAVFEAQKRFIIHRDIKTENVFLENDNVYLGDWGLSTVCDNPHKKQKHETVQTLWYRAPEILAGYNYTNKIDIWSIGIVMYDMLCRQIGSLTCGNFSYESSKTDFWQFSKFCDVFDIQEEDWEFYQEPLIHRFNCKRSRKQLRYSGNTSIFSPEFILKHNIGLSLCDLLRRIFAFNPDKRITAFEALNHPYFTDIAVPVTPMLPQNSLVQVERNTKILNVAKSQLTADMISDSLELYFMITHKCKYSPSIIFVAMDYLYEYASSNVIDMMTFDDLCVACFVLASKLNEFDVPESALVAKWHNRTFDTEIIKRFELILAKMFEPTFRVTLFTITQFYVGTIELSKQKQLLYLLTLMYSELKLYYVFNHFELIESLLDAIGHKTVVPLTIVNKSTGNELMMMLEDIPRKLKKNQLNNIKTIIGLC